MPQCSNFQYRPKRYHPFQSPGTVDDGTYHGFPVYPGMKMKKMKRILWQISQEGRVPAPNGVFDDPSCQGDGKSVAVVPDPRARNLDGLHPKVIASFYYRYHSRERVERTSPKSWRRM
jgi:hypothetical protein